jgi:hypothetical protein
VTSNIPHPGKLLQDLCDGMKWRRRGFFEVTTDDDFRRAGISDVVVTRVGGLWKEGMLLWWWV